jgi:tricarballylate dehydrogenase
VTKQTTPAPSWTGQSPEAPSPAEEFWGVTVVGGGNASLAAAISAADGGRRVLLPEAVPQHLRAGNTRHTRNIRAASFPDGKDSGIYFCEEFLSDLYTAGARPVNPHLAQFAVVWSAEARAWMTAHRARWLPPLRRTFALRHTNDFALGGGTALANHCYRVAARAGVIVPYSAKLIGFDLKPAEFARVGPSFSISAARPCSGSSRPERSWWAASWRPATLPGSV